MGAGEGGVAVRTELELVGRVQSEFPLLVWLRSGIAPERVYGPECIGKFLIRSIWSVLLPLMDQTIEAQVVGLLLWVHFLFLLFFRLQFRS